MQHANSVEIDRPIAEVFERTIRDVADWSIIVVEDEIVKETPEVVGTTFRTVTVDHGRRDEFDGVVTLHEEPTRHAVFMKGKSFDIQAEYDFEDLGGRTRVTQTSKVKGKGVYRIMLPVMSLFMKKAGCEAVLKELNSLKAYIESRTGQN